MDVYCAALLNQEKSLEDLQRHLRTTEELFRESVKRKNQQLDLLQSEVRRLKTSVGVRDEAASLQIDAALNAQAGELRRAHEKLAARDAEVDALTKQVNKLKLELADERALRDAERAKGEEATGARHALQRREEEVESLREELAQAQQAAGRLQAASAEAEASLVARDAELAALREREQANVAGVAASELHQREFDLLRSKADEAERSVAEERHLRASAEAHAQSLEKSRDDFEAQADAQLARVEAERDALAQELQAMRHTPASGAPAEREVQRLQAKVEQLQQQLADVPSARVPPAVAPPSRAPEPAPAMPAVSRSMSGGGGAAAGGPPAGAACSSSSSSNLLAADGGAPMVRSLVVAGEPIIGMTLTARAAFLGADENASKYAWYRGEGGQMLSAKTTYVVAADDLGHELIVRVTPVSASNEVGDPLRAAASAPVAIPGNVHALLKGWHEIGQKAFTNCAEGDKERQVLFTHDKLKLRDRAGKTIAKSDSYQNVAVRMRSGDTTGFTLAIGNKKGVQEFELHAPAGVRDLISLVLSVFADPPSLERMPVAPASAATGTSSLHLSAVGSLNAPKVEGGGSSPASSMTSEQQSLADLEETSQKKKMTLAAAGKRLSFPIRSKKK